MFVRDDTGEVKRSGRNIRQSERCKVDKGKAEDDKKQNKGKTKRG